MGNIILKQFILAQLLAFSLLLTASCTPTKNKELKLPIVEFVSKSHKIKPEWVSKGPPKDTDEFLFFVGKSGKQAEEADAIDAARSKAGKAFIELAGVEIQIFEEYLTSSSGRSSIARDTYKVGETKTKQSSEGFFRGLKLIESYSENYRKKQGDHVIENYWRVSALVRVPQKEKSAVQEWKREREERADSFLNQQLDDSRQAVQRGDLFGALSQLSSMLSIAPKQPTPKRDNFIAQAKKLEALWLNSIEFYSLSPKTQIVELGNRFKPFEVKAEIHFKEKRIPIRNFPLLFKMGPKEKTKFTNVEGIASVEIPLISGVGEEYLNVSPDGKKLRDLIPGKDLSHLSGKIVSFRSVVKASFLKQRIKNDFTLKFYSSIDRKYKVGDEVEVSSICERRCHVRIYSWDGENGELIRDAGERTMIKNKPQKLLHFKLKKISKFTLVALSTTDKFPDEANKENKYSAKEFETLLSGFRNMNIPKAEEHLEFIVSTN
jgi:hypothetical protein